MESYCLSSDLKLNDQGVKELSTYLEFISGKKGYKDWSISLEKRKSSGNFKYKVNPL